MYIDIVTAEEKTRGGGVTFENRGGILFRVSAVPCYWRIACDGVVFAPGKVERIRRTDVSKYLKPAFSDLHMFADNVEAISIQQRRVVFNILSELFRECSIGRRITGVPLSSKQNELTVSKASGTADSSCTDTSDDNDDDQKHDSNDQTVTTMPSSLYHESSSYLFDENLINIILDEYVGGFVHSTKPSLVWYLDLTGWNLNDTMFFQASKVDFTNAILHDCHCQKTHFDKIRFTHADCTNCDFRNSNFTDISLDGCILDYCDFTGCTFKATRRFKLMLAARLTGKGATRRFVESGKESSPLPTADEPPVRPGGFRALSAGSTSSLTSTSTPMSPDLHSVACVFGQALSMKGCIIDRSVYDLNPGWFDSMSVPAQDYPPPPPKFVATQARIDDCIMEESYWEYE